MKQKILFASIALTIACASVGIKQKVSQAHQTVHQALVVMDDAERALCAPAPSAPNTCTSPAAVAVGLTDAKHQQFSNLLVKAYKDDEAASVAIIAWRAGDPVPTDVSTLVHDAQDLIAVANSLTDQPLIGKVQAFLVRAQAAVDAFQQ